MYTHLATNNENEKLAAFCRSSRRKTLNPVEWKLINVLRAVKFCLLQFTGLYDQVEFQVAIVR